ncbi:transglutaminase-like domain-containing protein [Candidatus Marinimicrobia bacterium]|nr:transglutaminase-like domain-containing protein [Candidatus Neomarinimicrobiota bacterium]
MRFLPKLIFIILFVGCNSNNKDKNSLVDFTAEIQLGIENHIEKKSLIGHEFFKLEFEEKELNLKLVKVHTEYLSNLGPQEHFACVDLASTNGFVYDVDFFLSGNPGEMIVTETTVHKINGQPLYLWEQNSDKTWHRVSAENASPELLGVIKEKDRFEFTYRATLPEMNKTSRIWIPVPVSDEFQEIELKSFKSPVAYEILDENNHGNKVYFMELNSENSGQIIEINYLVNRREKGVYENKLGDPLDYLRPNRLVPANEDFNKIAKKVVDGKLGSLAQARALYDHTIDRMKYIKTGDGWGKGDAVYACDLKTGNCTDFHSYFIALARSVDIPARFAIGASIPSSRNEGGIDGYHCWAEFYTNGKWWPIDISEGDKCSALSTYYFGHNPANRIEFSHGRDLVVEPGPESGPINFLAYPVLEIGGKLAKAKVEFTFNRIPFTSS